MNYRNQPLLLVVAALLLTGVVPARLDAGEEAGLRSRKTVRDLIMEFGVAPKTHTQLRLKIEGEVEGKEFAKLPKTMSIDLRYDKAGNRILVVTDSTFKDGSTRRVSAFSDEERAAKWTERSATADGAKPIFRVERMAISQALPNPWRLPMHLDFPGIFADSLFGYEALSREFARSQRLNREPDAEGLIWFNLRPSPGVANVLQGEFNAGMEVKVAFATEGGWLERMDVSYTEAETVIKLRVVEHSTELSEADVAEFAIPERVERELEKLPKPKSVAGSELEPKVGPLKELEPKAAPEQVEKKTGAE